MTGGVIYLAIVCVFLIVVCVLMYRLFTLGSPPKECNHIYTMYSPTASSCALCGKEHPYSNKMPVLNERYRKTLDTQKAHRH